MQSISNGSPLSEYHPYQSPQERVQTTLFAASLLAPYAFYFTRDALIGRNESLNCRSTYQPLNAGTIVCISHSDVLEYFPAWSSIPGPVMAEIGNELWTTGIRTIRQLRLVYGDHTTSRHYHVSFPSNVFKDVITSYMINPEEMLHYPNPVKADYSNRAYHNGQWISEIDCSPPDHQWMSLSPWAHNIDSIFDGAHSRNTSPGNRYSPSTSYLSPIFGSPNLDRSVTSLPSPSTSQYKIEAIGDHDLVEETAVEDG